MAKKTVPAKKKSFQVESVTVKYGMTLNLGNFEFFRVDAEATLRCGEILDTPEQVEKIRKEMFAEGWQMVKNELVPQVRSIREGQEKKKKD